MEKPKLFLTPALASYGEWTKYLATLDDHFKAMSDEERVSLEAHRASLQEKLNQLEKLGQETQSLTFQEIELEQSLGSLRSQSQAILPRISQAKENCKCLKEELAKKKNKLGAQQRAARDLQALSKKLEGEILEKEEALHLLHLQAGSAQSRLCEVQTWSSKMERNLRTTQSLEELTTKILAKKQETRKSLEESLEALRASQAKEEASTSSLQSSIAVLRQAMADLKTRRDDLSRDYETLKKEELDLLDETGTLELSFKSLLSLKSKVKAAHRRTSMAAHHKANLPSQTTDVLDLSQQDLLHARERGREMKTRPRSQTTQWAWKPSAVSLSPIHPSHERSAGPHERSAHAHERSAHAHERTTTLPPLRLRGPSSSSRVYPELPCLVPDHDDDDSSPCGLVEL